MESAIAKKIFPGGVLLTAEEGNITFFEAYGMRNLFTRDRMTRETIFDLASLTKPLATALAVMKLMELNRVTLDTNLGQLLPEASQDEKQSITLEHLLTHSAGFPAYRPYYLRLSNLPDPERKPGIRALLAKEALAYPPGQGVLYSDLGFMVLEWVIERAAGMTLDVFLQQMIYTPLGVSAPFFIDISIPINKDFAATEFCPWRNILLEGRVHDENAYVSGGVQGHAGLFGTAGDVYHLLKELLSVFHGHPASGIFKQDLAALFFSPCKNTGRSLGFDRPSPVGSSCGNYFSPDTIGHLGFTGTSFWVDLKQAQMVILLTNRIHPSRNNLKIKKFRPELHDAVMKRPV